MEHKEVKVWKFGRCYSFSNRCILIFQGVVLDVNLESGDRPFTFQTSSSMCISFFDLLSSGADPFLDMTAGS